MRLALVELLIRRSRQAVHRGLAKSVPRSAFAPTSEALRWGPIELLSARFPNPPIEVRWVRWSRFRLAKRSAERSRTPVNENNRDQTETTPPSPNTALNQQIPFLVA
jgi:hypothetical protein